MPNPVREGINSSGNRYTIYDNGGFRYVNTTPEGKTGSSFYDNGKGTAFFRKNQPDGYSWHENQKKGTRTYIEKSSGKSKGSSDQKKWIKKFNLHQMYSSFFTKQNQKYFTVAWETRNSREFFEFQMNLMHYSYACEEYFVDSFIIAKFEDMHWIRNLYCVVTDNVSVYCASFFLKTIKDKR